MHCTPGSAVYRLASRQECLVLLAVEVVIRVYTGSERYVMFGSAGLLPKAVEIWQFRLG